MHSLAAYSFETSLESDQAELRLQRVDELVDAWLARKGAEVRLTEGSFLSRSGDGTGQFSRKLTDTTVGSLREVELIETAHTGEMFTTVLQVAFHTGTLSVFATLGVTPESVIVAPMNLNPRCPAVIRSLIEEFHDWTFGGQPVPLPTPFAATQEADVLSLRDALRSSQRRLPVVVISCDEDEMVWRGLPEAMGRHLIGLADVAFVDAESSWTLTDELGKQDSCYLGAVRLYWPRANADGGLRGQTWTASRLVSFGENDAGMNRFLSTIRQTVMSAAALTMSPPKGVREVQQAATRERLQALEAGARETELNAIVEENAQLSAELQAAHQSLADLRWHFAAYRSEHGDERESDAEDELERLSPEHILVEDGETRYYKKVGTGGGVDSLVVTDACNHKSSAWRPAFKGVQAEKGIAKLERRADWKSIAHCGACTGGGRWRVQW